MTGHGFRRGLIGGLALLLTGCGLFGGADVPERGATDFPDLADIDAAPTVTPADDRQRTVDQLQAKAVRASLDRDVIPLQLAGKLPKPLDLSREAMIPPRMRRLQAMPPRPIDPTAPPPLPSVDDLPPSRPAGG